MTICLRLHVSQTGQISDRYMTRLGRWSLGWLMMNLLFGAMPLFASNTPEPEYLTVRNGLPQGFVKSLIQDRRGFIWLATRDGLCRYDGVRFRIYNHDPQRVGSLSFSSIYEIKEDKKGRLWLRTENNNVDCFDPVTEQTHRISASPQFRQAVGRHSLVGIFPDQYGNVWVATRTNGFFRLSQSGIVSHHHWPAIGDTVQRNIHALLLDRRGHPWVAARDGLFRYDPETGAFTGFRIGQGLPQNDVLSLHERTNGELMLGFPGRFTIFDPVQGQARQTVALPAAPTQIPLFTKDYRGLDYINQNRYTDQAGLVSLADPEEPVVSSKLAHFSAMSLLVDRSNVLWIGTNGDGVIKYDLNKRLFKSWPYQTNFIADWMTQQAGIPASSIPVGLLRLGANDIYSKFDRQKVLWIGGADLPPYYYNKSSQSFELVRPAGIEPRWLPNGTFRMTALATGPQGVIWGLLGPDSRAVVRHNPDLHTFTAFPLPLPPNHPYEIMAMTVDGGRIYLATRNHGLLRADLSAHRLIHWGPNPADSGSLPNDALLSLAQDPAQYNHLWIGTFGSGLCQLDKITGRIRRFTTANGLPNNVIYAIQPDGNGYLWLSTNRGLCRFDSRTFEVRSYAEDDGLPSEEFVLHHHISLPDGRMVFGGIGGYTVFDPRKIDGDPFKPIVALTALRINNQPVSATDPDSPIRRDINETSNIRLNHLQNFLSFDFAALQFNQPNKNQYRYKLVGLDNDWVYSKNQATATYTNLPPATYTFVVNASNTSGVWSPYTRKIQLLIEPPLWQTWWAYVGYIVLLLGAIVLYVRTRINRIRLRSQMELREQESMQLKNLDAVKSRFFANITHEFRTPLTLILGPLEQLLQEVSQPQQQSRLALVYSNANRLLRLINELLDLAKLEAGSLTITPTPGDLADFVERTTRVFDEEAQRKHVRLEVYSQLATPYYWFDGEKVEKILNNLLANAFRFTGEDGSITVSVMAVTQPADESSVGAGHTLDDRIRLIVTDTGAGIDDAKLPHIFNRFYQADATTDRSVSGSGIGLALVKELVEMMDGNVTVKSRPGFGTTFVVELPCRPAFAVSEPDGGTSQIQTKSAKYVPVEEITSEGLQRLLLVEDNDDIADYVVSILSPLWQVRRVANGREGIDAAIADGPDLIISDVLMPELDGYELCRQLKSNSLTSHIPILLLTAKTALESRIEGLNAGADDYIQKPFQVEELLGRVRNRLEQQQRSRHHFRTQLLREGHLPAVSQSPDDEFMNRVYAALEERLDDSSFGVEPMAQVVGMSRMHLNRKIKAMTGMTPNELIRTVRLNRAAELLVTGASVSETADRVGFDTPAYFSKVFKEQYHLTPSEYADKNRHELAR
ncbi:MAG: hybrid sensor histidine kinase/response regulator [Spirosoma sp.]|nr:hybrid sensor histidine kinase/response regulator [Spirosoma sp.]